MQFDAYSDSNRVGPEHSENQDSYLADEEYLLFAVADGVGGYEGAKEASSFAIEKLERGGSNFRREKPLAVPRSNS